MLQQRGRARIKLTALQRAGPAMNQTAEPDLHSETVSATITYALHTGEKPVNETFEAGQVIRRRTGATEERLTQVRDARPLRKSLSLDVQGFVLVDHRSAVRDFFDPEELKSTYYREVERLVRDVSGASRVVVFDHTLGTGNVAEQEPKKIQRAGVLGAQRLHGMVRPAARA